MRARSYFGPELFQFLRELALNNRREWFLENKERYETQVREPMLQFIADFGFRLEKISRSYEADPRPAGGSLFRIYRDTRFSRDKRPYKTHTAAHFRHGASRTDVHSPGFYLHLEPGNCFAGGGLWHAEPATLRKVRDAIIEHPRTWETVLRGKVSLEGDVLKRPPQGYDPTHPFIEDLKRKDFVTAVSFTEAQVCGPRFLASYVAVCRAMSPLMEFLTKAVGLEW
ncbi:MAG: DUF2461 domain-containing protein [Candidatus Entotheonellia bacterium]